MNLLLSVNHRQAPLVILINQGRDIINIRDKENENETAE